nr:zinc finger, CCHC-type [Tanacetum cinerariifolium]
MPEPFGKIKKEIKNNIEPIAPTMTVNRLVLEWEERIKLHQEKEMEFDQWRSKNFNNEFPTTKKGNVDLKTKEESYENHISTLGDYSKHSHEGYRNTIELPEVNNMVPLRSGTIRLVQNGCSFHGLWSEDPNQRLKDFLKLVESLDPNGDNRE